MFAVTLRPPVAADAATIARYCGEWDLARMTRSIPHPYTLADAQALLARIATDPEEVALMVLANGHVAGMVGWVLQDGVPDLGYWIGAEWRGKGLAQAAARLALTRIFAGGASQVTACVFQDNPASRRVLLQLGFRETGVCRGYSQARGAEAPAFTFRLEARDWTG